MGLDLQSQLIEYLRAMGWALTASIGFALGVAIAVFIFNKRNNHHLNRSNFWRKAQTLIITMYCNHNPNHSSTNSPSILIRLLFIVHIMFTGQIWAGSTFYLNFQFE